MCDKSPKEPESNLDIFKECMLCTAKHCALRSSKPKLYGDVKSGYLRQQQPWKMIIINLTRF